MLSTQENKSTKKYHSANETKRTLLVVVAAPGLTDLQPGPPTVGF